MENSPFVSIEGFSFNVYGISLIAMFLVFIILLWRAHMQGTLDWKDMITQDGKKVSTTKILQLVGGVVGTWIVVQITMQGKLTWDLFAIYLGYAASIDSFSKLIMAKYTGRNQILPDTNTPCPPPVVVAPVAPVAPTNVIPDLPPTPWSPTPWNQVSDYPIAAPPIPDSN